MQTIFYPGNVNQPCRAEFDIVIDNRGVFPQADIVVVNSNQWGGQTWLVNNDQSRDFLLNNILANNLRGVSISFIRFCLIMHAGDLASATGFEFPIHKACSVQRPKSLRWKLANLIGGSDESTGPTTMEMAEADRNFYTDFEERRQLSKEQTETWLAAVGDSLVAPDDSEDG